MADYKQKNRVLSFTCPTSPLGADKLLALKLRGTEAISELFEYEAELLAEPEIVVKPSALLGKRVTITMEVGSGRGKQRYFNGVVAQFETAGGDAIFNKYRVQIVPAMWMLSLHRQTRVFQDKTVLDIVRKVLEPYSIMPRVNVKSLYPTLEYCTQYRETDLEFVERLLEEHGIFYYFIHNESDHLLMFSDTSSLCAECPYTSDFDYQDNTEGMLDFYKPLIYDFRSRSTLISGKHTYWDYRFMQYALSHATPQTERSRTEMGNNSHELYDYADSAATYFKTEEGDAKIPDMQTHLQTVERDGVDAQATRCAGYATANTMQAGFTFTLHKHPQAESNIKHLLTRVEHSIRQSPLYRAHDPLEKEPVYRNSFEARPFTQVFRKSLSRRKPRVSGVVTGKVVTFPGEDSYLDRFGRVCVQFWWDRDRLSPNPDKTLLRVAQQWAGKEWGTYFWPRVGDEVLIDFIEGDPDAPIVIGSLYNGVNLPKYDPKSQYTRSGILTRSSKDGKTINAKELHANELRFDDRKGSEQIFINAERNFDLHVENDLHTRVDRHEHHHVANNQYHRVGGNAQLSIAKNQRVQVTGNRTISVDGAQTVKASTLLTEVSGVQTSNTNGTHIIYAGGTVNVQSLGPVILQTDAVLCLVIGGVGLAITAEGLGILAALNVGEIMALPLIPPTIPPLQPCDEEKPEWPGDS